MVLPTTARCLRLDILKHLIFHPRHPYGRKTLCILLTLYHITDVNSYHWTGLWLQRFYTLPGNVYQTPKSPEMSRVLAVLPLLPIAKNSSSAYFPCTQCGHTSMATGYSNLIYLRKFIINLPN